MEKNKHIKVNVFVLLLLSLNFSSCLEKQIESIEQQIDSSGIYQGFEFNTTQNQDYTITTLNFSNEPIKGAVLEIYSQNPLDEQGILVENNTQYKVATGITNENGEYTVKLDLPSIVDSIYIISKYIGLPHKTAVSTYGYTNIIIGGSLEYTNTNSAILKSSQVESVTIVNGYYTLGSWNSQGVPNYLDPVKDEIDQAFLNDVNASLPEGITLPQSHPQYLASNSDANLIVNEQCEIWVTFVHEGAGWLNLLGYYTYSIDDPPATVDDIRDKTVIFPNVSYQNSGGGLLSGDKVQLYYLDPITNEYSRFFPPNTVVSWFITGQGWRNGTVTNGIYTHYSDIKFNAEQDADLKKHNVMLYDDQRNILLLGFEDIRRDSGSDEDFNDAVFYTTITPNTAVNTEFYQPIDTPTDSDGDGVTDVFDAYPNDPSKAFQNHYPGENLFGTLVYEDLWPYKGDYDFNDLVIDYNFNQVTDAQNHITGIQSKIVVKAIGASYHNAFGLLLNTSPNNIASVSGQRFTRNYLDISSNGTENNQSKASIILFDDAFNNLPYPGSGIGVNTSTNAPYVVPDTQFVNIDFVEPLTFAILGTAPYNPFMIINRDRGVEVHLPNKEPTDLVDQTLLGTGDDDSNPSIGEYYVSNKYLPWAINIPVSFSYPIEKEDVQKAHLMFSPWAVSRGYNYMDWYKDMPGYRNNNKIY
nr:LruC domain-containing protein [uncultured Carboxylicivirga sp.]